MAQELDELRENLKRAREQDANCGYYLSRCLDQLAPLEQYVRTLEDTVATLSGRIVNERKD